MIKAKCERECLWHGRLWRIGQTYAGEETPPHHFAVYYSDAPEAAEQDAAEPEQEPEKKAVKNDRARGRK